MAKSEIEFAAEQSEKMTELLRNGILAAINEDNTYLYADVVDYMMAHGATVPVRCKDCENSRAIKETDPNAHEYAEDCVWCMAHDVGFGKDDFCSYGERREG